MDRETDLTVNLISTHSDTHRGRWRSSKSSLNCFKQNQTEVLASFNLWIPLTGWWVSAGTFVLTKCSRLDQTHILHLSDGFWWMNLRGDWIIWPWWSDKGPGSLKGLIMSDDRWRKIVLAQIYLFTSIVVLLLPSNLVRKKVKTVLVERRNLKESHPWRIPLPEMDRPASSDVLIWEFGPPIIQALMDRVQEEYNSDQYHSKTVDSVFVSFLLTLGCYFCKTSLVV